LGCLLWAGLLLPQAMERGSLDPLLRFRKNRSRSSQKWAQRELRPFADWKSRSCPPSTEANSNVASICHRTDASDSMIGLGVFLAV
jgi:hypothetical protein